MPLLLAAAIAWVAGTAAGLTAAGTATTAALAVLLSALALPLLAFERSRAAASLLLLALAALELGAGVRRTDAACVAGALRERHWTVRLEGAAAPGSFVRASAPPGSCALDVLIALRSGTASSGSLVRVDGAEPTAGDRGVLLRDATLTPVRGPGPLARWRNGVAAMLDRRFGVDAPIVRALLIADTKGLSPELRDRYADAGLVHLLSISGLHVAIVGGALLLLFRALRLPWRAASGIAVAATVLYVLAIGAPPPAARSVTLFAAVTLAKAMQRPTSPWGVFALGALVPLVDPRTVLDLGWQLSVSGYAAVLVAARLGRRLPEGLAGWRRSLVRELVAGVLTTAATAPLVAWHFGRLSLIAPISNLAVGPVVAMLQPALFLVMFTPDGPVAAFAVDAIRPLLRTMDGIAAAGAAVPGGAVVVAPTRLAATVAGVGVGALLFAGWARHWARPLTIAIGTIVVLAWLPSIPLAGGHEAEIHLLDVGQGDAIAIRSPKGRWVVVDAGRSWRGGDAGRAIVIPYLRRLGGEVALVVLTHPHADHIGGTASLLRALRPRELRDPGFAQGSALYRELLLTAGAVGTRWQRVRPGERIDVDGVAVEFLAPDSVWTASLSDPNEASAVVRVRYGDVRVLLTGDAERGEEAWLLAHAEQGLSADVLKVGHHGSATSSTSAFIQAVSPRVALVSVGAVNGYGHPSPDVMRRLTDAGTTVLRTDQLGTVVLRTDGRTLEASAAGHRWRVARPLPAMP